MIKDTDTMLGKVVLRCTPEDAGVYRHHFERLMAGADLCPPRVPACAILCIRKLRDPRPYTWRCDAAASFLDGQWQRALLSEIDALAMAAVRPLREVVPSDATSVLFADRSEMLACATRDWVRGTCSLHWWWRNLAWMPNAGMHILPLWLEKPEYVGGTWQHLSAIRELHAFARTLTASQAGLLLTATMRQYRAPLGHLVRMFEERTPESSQRPSTKVHSGKAAASGRTAEQVLPLSHTPAPWRRIAPEVTSNGLSLWQECAAGLGLAFHRAPLLASDSEFLKAVAHWVEAGLQPPPPYESHSVPVQPRPAQLVNETGALPLSHGTRPPIPGSNAPEVESPGEGSWQVTQPGAAISTAHMAEPNRPAVPPGLAGNSVIHAGAPRELSNAPATVWTNSAPASDETEIVAEPGESSWTATEYGGVFFLLNLAHYLELYGDITTPSIKDLPLVIWDFLALLGERLSGVELRSDPVWKLLANLALREDDEEPGAQVLLTLGWPGLDHPVPASNWLDSRLPAIQERLRQALGMADVLSSGDMLCHRGARIYRTATHLDVTFSLAEHAVAIRFAGLDRDPGWIPATGRIIRFHFQ